VAVREMFASIRGTSTTRYGVRGPDDMGSR
jgi:hypothetical protein